MSAKKRSFSSTLPTSESPSSAGQSSPAQVDMSVAEVAFDIDMLDARTSNAAYSALLGAISDAPLTAEQAKAAIRADKNTVLAMLRELATLGLVQTPMANIVAGAPIVAKATGRSALAFLRSNTHARRAVERALAPPDPRMPCAACGRVTLNRCASCRTLPFCSSVCLDTGHRGCSQEFGYVPGTIDISKEKEFDEAAAAAAVPKFAPRRSRALGAGRGGRGAAARRYLAATTAVHAIPWDE